MTQKEIDIDRIEDTIEGLLGKLESKDTLIAQLLMKVDNLEK